MASLKPYEPILCVVDFNHQRGPEVEHWFGLDPETFDTEKDWSLLPFLALSDGSHAATEDFSYFTLIRRHDDESSSSLFGIACTRQLDASTLINRPPSVTRSSVQKAVVIITDEPQRFHSVREKLGVVTKAWFAQRDFSDLSLLEDFRESLVHGFGDTRREDGPEGFLGLSLREIIHTYKWQTLVLLKCLLLQPKMLFFGQHCEQVCLLQFSLISLIPDLMRRLEDCADPELNSYASKAVKPTSLKSSDRASLLSYMGLPLQIFGKGSFFGPYTPLQQLDLLMDKNTKSYVVGSTNSLLLQQKDKYADVLVHLDETSVNIFSPTLRSALALSTADRRWIDFLTQAVNDTWDELNPSRPKDLGFTGSEEMIRMQFEEYLLALLSSARYSEHVASDTDARSPQQTEVEPNPSSEFSEEFMTYWRSTENYALFKRTTDSHIFDVVEPKHPCAGGLTVEDVQRRVAQQVSELHLDEKYRAGKEVLGKHLAEGSKKFSGALNSLWVDIEAMRKAQLKRSEDAKSSDGTSLAASQPATPGSGERSAGPGFKVNKPDLAQAQASVQAASSAAGAYLSSWGAWAAEKRKTGWRSSGTSATSSPGAVSVNPEPEGEASVKTSEPVSAVAKPESRAELGSDDAAALQSTAVKTDNTATSTTKPQDLT